MSTPPKKLNVLPFAQLLAVVFALLGFLAGVLYALGGLVYDLATTGSLNPGTFLAFLAMIGMPLIFSLAGLITGLIGGWLFNHFLRWLPTLMADTNFLEY